MSSTLVVYMVAIGGGIAVALQGQMMGVLDKGIGTLESVLITYGGGGLLIGLVMLLLKGGNISAWNTVPSFALLSGVLGLIIVASIGYTIPRLGLVTAFTLLIAAQFVIAAFMDHYGWLGADIRILTPQKIMGVVVMMAGVWLTLRN